MIKVVTADRIRGVQFTLKVTFRIDIANVIICYRKNTASHRQLVYLATNCTVILQDMRYRRESISKKVSKSEKLFLS